MDDFFNKTECDRCQGELKSRTMSWFNDETICEICAKEEKTLRFKLSEIGFNDSKLEGINLSIQSIRKLLKDSQWS